jgi:hypothetical protein
MTLAEEQVAKIRRQTKSETVVEFTQQGGVLLSQTTNTGTYYVCVMCQVLCVFCVMYYVLYTIYYILYVLCVRHLRSLPRTKLIIPIVFIPYRTALVLQTGSGTSGYL